MTQIDNSQDMLDVRDIISRYEELESERAALVDNCEELDGSDPLAVDAAAMAVANFDDSEEGSELHTLEELLESLKGNGGDEQWRGDWYPVTLIRESYFEEAMDEQIEDCFSEHYKDLPSFMTISLDYHALKMDYTHCDYEGVTYLYR